jgi:hypothetical protein
VDLDAYDVTYTNPDGTIDGPDNLLQVAANYIDEMASRNFGVGTTTVSYYVVDVNGNDVSCSFTVTVTDDEDPTFVNCPEDLTVNSDPDLCGANVIWSVPVAEDNCGVQSVTQTAGPAPGTFLPVGTTTIEYTGDSM